jgi:hypothetical protein
MSSPLPKPLPRRMCWTVHLSKLNTMQTAWLYSKTVPRAALSEILLVTRVIYVKLEVPSARWRGGSDMQNSRGLKEFHSNTSLPNRARPVNRDAAPSRILNLVPQRCINCSMHPTICGWTFMLPKKCKISA